MRAGRRRACSHSAASATAPARAAAITAAAPETASETAAPLHPPHAPLPGMRQVPWQARLLLPGQPGQRRLRLRPGLRQLLQEEQAAQHAKQKGTAKKARQKQRKQVCCYIVHHVQMYGDRQRQAWHVRRTGAACSDAPARSSCTGTCTAHQHHSCEATAQVPAPEHCKHGCTTTYQWPLIAL